MLKWSTTRFVTGLLCLFSLAGCGSGGDSNTNGQLALTVTATDLTGGQFNVVSTAVYTNAASSARQGVPIKITTSVHTLGGTPQVFVDNLSANTSGEVSSSKNIEQTTEVIFVDVTASTAGLSQSKTVAVPSL